MRGARRTVVSGVAVPTVLGLLSVAAAAASDVRTDLETLGLALDSAVLQVSRPARTGAAPRGAARGYRIAGFGAMFVLPPRVLPASKPQPTAEQREAARLLADAATAFERGMSSFAPAEVRPQVQQDVGATPHAELDLRMREKTGRRAAGEPEPPAPGEAPATPGPRTLEEDLQELEQDVQIQLRLQSEAARMMGDGLASMPADMRADYERQMRALHEQAESFRQRVERRRAMTEQSVLATLGAASPTMVVAAPAVSAPPSSPSPAPTTEEGLPLRPWTFWRLPQPESAPDPSSVIRDVGIAVARVLETQGARLSVLAPQESVTVAVDFVPATALVASARPVRTLLVRVRKADIDARGAGAIDGTEFTKRVEIVEY